MVDDIRLRLKEKKNLEGYPSPCLPGDLYDKDRGLFYLINGSPYIWGRVFVESIGEWWYGLISLADGNSWSAGIKMEEDTAPAFARAKPKKIDGIYTLVIKNGKLIDIERTHDA